MVQTKRGQCVIKGFRGRRKILKIRVDQLNFGVIAAEFAGVFEDFFIAVYADNFRAKTLLAAPTDNGARDIGSARAPVQKPYR